MRQSLVILDDVLVVRRTDNGWFCDVPKYPHVRFIGVLQVALATPMPSEGSRGRVVLTASAASDLGLAPPRRSPG